MELINNLIEAVTGLALFVPDTQHEKYKRQVQDRMHLFATRLTDTGTFVDIEKINVSKKDLGKPVDLFEEGGRHIESMLISINGEIVFHNKWLEDGQFFNHFHSTFSEKVHVIVGNYEVTFFDNEGNFEKIIRMDETSEELVIPAGKKHNVFGTEGTQVVTKFKKEI